MDNVAAESGGPASTASGAEPVPRNRSCRGPVLRGNQNLPFLLTIIGKGCIFIIQKGVRIVNEKGPDARIHRES